MNELLSTLFLLDGFVLSRYERATLHAGWSRDNKEFCCWDANGDACPEDMQVIRIDEYWNYLITISRGCFDTVDVTCNVIKEGKLILDGIEFSLWLEKVIEHSDNIATFGDYLISQMRRTLQKEYAYQLLMAAKTE